MAEGKKSLRREQQNGRELLSFVKNPSPQAPGSRPSLWGHSLSPAKTLAIPQNNKQLTKDCFSAGCGLPELPPGNVGNDMASKTLVFCHLVGQTVSQGGTGPITLSPPQKEASRTEDTDGSCRAEPMRGSSVATMVVGPNLSLFFGHK